MCGIVGIFKPKENIDNNIANFKQALDSIQHRGPDNTGIAQNNHFLFGHQRLSIIDLSKGANQPLQSACKRYTIVFNGEIYNFNELRAKHNIQTKTQSDTEVLVELYAKLGDQCVNEIQGIFAFAIYDEKENSVFLARDRNGIKPLYYSLENQTLAFASELKAFYSINPSLTDVISQKSISTFLHTGFIPAPYTIFERINKLPGGYWLKHSATDTNLVNYYSPRFEPSHELNLNYLKNIIEKSVTKQLVADVPIGSFLSGGIDSSLVTAIAQRNHAAKIKTFTIGFKDAQKNEAEHAAKIATYLGTEHYEHYFSESDALDITETAMDLFDEPFSDSSAIPVYLLSKLTSKQVKVALAGDGGDELFLGYGSYIWAKRLSNKAIFTSRKIIKPLLRYSGTRNRRASWLFDFNQNDFLPSHIFSQEQYLFSCKELRKNLKTPFNSLIHSFQKINSSDYILQQQFFDLQYYLPDDLLTKVDRASMAHGLEVRVPLLDEDIEAYINCVPVKDKMKNGVLKYATKELLHEYLPHELFNRPKQGFSVPLARWLKSDLRYFIDRYLNDETVVMEGIVDADYTRKLKKQFLEGEDILYNRVWALIILHRWLNKHRILKQKEKTNPGF